MKRILISLIFLTATESRAFILSSQNGRFSKPDSIKINISDLPCDTAGITHEQIRVIAQKAIEKWWNRVPTSSLHIEIGGVVPFTTSPEENTITISCYTSSSFSASTSYPNAVGGFSIHPSGGANGFVLINNVFPGTWSYVENPYLLFVMGHELGHALNLHHSDDPASLMTYNTSDPDMRPWDLASLSQDDMDGITYLYPIESKFGGLLGGCGTVAGLGKGHDDIPPSGVIALFAGVFLVFLLLRLNTSVPEATRS